MSPEPESGFIFCPSSQLRCCGRGGQAGISSEKSSCRRSGIQKASYQNQGLLLSRLAVAAVTKRASVCRFASTEKLLSVFFSSPFHRREIAALVRPIAKRLFRGLSTCAPEVGFPRFHFYPYWCVTCAFWIAHDSFSCSSSVCAASFGFHKCFSACAGKSSDTQDIALTLCNRNHATRVQQVEHMRSLDALVVSRMRHDD